MKNIYIYSAALTLITCNVLSQVTINVTPSDKKQTIVGFGANIDCDTALLFDIGTSMVRIGRDDTGMEPVNDNSDPMVLDLSKFTDLDAKTIQYVKTLNKRNIKFIFVISTPPAWMKDTNSPKMYWRVLEAAGKPASEVAAYRYRYECGGELRSDMYQEFGEFVAGKLLKFKEQTGCDVYSVSPQNEPEFWEPYWSCVYTGAQMVEATKAVGAQLALNGLTTKINFADQCFPQNHITAWAVLCNNDPDCKGYVSAFSSHDYSDDPMGGGMSDPLKWASIYNESKRVSPVKETWQTEGGPGYSDTKSDHTIAMGGAQQFHYSMRYGNATVFLGHVYLTTNAYTIRAASLKSMFRFVRPGSYRVTAITASASDTFNIQPLVFKHDASGTTTVIVNNKADVEKKIKINGISGVFDMFCTAENKACNWLAQVDLANEITLLPMSITTLVNCPGNKLPVIAMPDTLVLIKNAGIKSFDLSGINDGGEGNQTITLSAWAFAPGPVLFNSVNTTYTSPNTTGKLNLTTKTDQTGMTYINIAVRDNSNVLDSMFNEKIISVPVYLLPYINKAPTLNDIDDQAYAKSLINTTQLLMLSNVTDGNDGKQKLTLTATSDKPWIATVATQGSTLLQITPKAEGTITITVTIKDDGVNAGGGIGIITKTFTVVVGSGINAVEEQKNEFVIYPNPAKDFFTIENKGMQFTRLEIINMDGVVIRNEKLAGENVLIQLNSISSGIYVVKLTGKTATSEKTIIVE